MSENSLIHILHHQTDEIIDWIDEVNSDSHKQPLSPEEKEQYDFEVSAFAHGVDKIQSRSRFIIPGEDDGVFHEFILWQIEDDTEADIKTISTYPSYKDLNKLKQMSAQVLDGQTVEQAADYILAGTPWDIGIVEYSGIKKWIIEKNMGAYDALKAIASLFDCELQFRIAVSGSRVTGRYVDFLKRLGADRGDEIEFGKNLIGINRKVNDDQLVTALLCIGPEKQDGERLTTIVKDDEAFQNWNWQGQHLIQTFEPNSNDDEMTLEQLTELGQKELKKRISSAVEYEVTVESPNYNRRLGDTSRVKDERFNPPMYLESRVVFIERSIFDDSKKTYKLGEVIEYKKEDVLKVWKSLQALYAMKVIKSPNPPPGRTNAIWIKTGGSQEIAHTWDIEIGKWVPTGGSLYTWVMYADDDQGNGITEFSAGKDYIGFAYNKTSQSPSQIPSDYEWTLIKGEKGIQGDPGDDGNPTFIWIKYADTPTSGISDDPTGKDYIGVAYNKKTEIESTNYEDYTWSLIKGDKGLKGDTGRDGTTYYTWLKYADDAQGNGMTETSDGKDFIGLSYNNLDPIESNDPTKYTWSRFKGDKGVQGDPGDDGQPTYTWIKYGDDTNGSGITDDPTGKKYIGLAYNRSVISESTNPADYTWSLIQGPEGPQGPEGLRGLQGDKGDKGVKGDPGDDGISSYTHIAYSTSPNGSTDFSVIDSTNKTYIGVYVDQEPQDSTTPSDYRWTLIKGQKGDKGIPGDPGDDGQTPYFHTAWANSADGTTGFSIIESLNKSYIGTYTDFIEQDSTDSTRYSWTRIKDESVNLKAAGNLLKRVAVTGGTLNCGFIENNTSVYVNDELILTGSECENAQLSVIKGDIIHSNKPIVLMYNTGYYPPSMSMASKRFGITTERNSPHSIYAYAEKTAKVEIRRDDRTKSTPDYIIDVPSGTAKGILVEDDGGVHKYYIESTTDILLSKFSNTGVDFVSPFPPGKEILVKSNTEGIMVWGNSPVNAVNGSSFYFTCEDEITTIAIGDGAGSDCESAIPWEYCGDIYHINHDISGYRIATIEPCTVNVYGWDGSNWVLYNTHDMTSASRINPIMINDGDDAGTGVTYGHDFWMFDADGPFMLRTNQPTTQDEYTVLGYRKELKNVILRGPQGDKGDKGDKGDTGEQGLRGLQGDKGDKGIKGDPGADGTSSYTHIAYSTSADGSTGFSVSDPNNKTYIGMYVDSSPTDSTTPSKYKWTLIKGQKGDKGIPGDPGDDGQTPYFHTAYANDINGNSGFSVSDSKGRSYIGTYTDFNSNDSTDPTKYTWSLIKGFDSRLFVNFESDVDFDIHSTSKSTIEQSTDSFSGTKAALLKSSELNPPPSGGNTSSSAAAKNIPFEIASAFKTQKVRVSVYAKQTANNSSNQFAMSYSTNKDGNSGWFMFTPTTSWSKYSMEYNVPEATDSSDDWLFIWADTTGSGRGVLIDNLSIEIVGPQGDKGDKGDKGDTGPTLYTWIKYATTPTSGMSDDPTGKAYIGIAYNKTTPTESTSYNAYTWSLIEGPEGPEGPKGDQGQAQYTWIKYGTSSTGGTISDSPTGKTYIGIAYNKTTPTESNNPSDYIWSLIQGPTGPKGDKGNTGDKGDTGPQGPNIVDSTTEIEANVIKANHMDVSHVSAISSDLGTVLAGLLKGVTIETTGGSGKITLSGDTLKTVWNEFVAELSGGELLAYLNNSPNTYTKLNTLGLFMVKNLESVLSINANDTSKTNIHVLDNIILSLGVGEYSASAPVTEIQLKDNPTSDVVIKRNGTEYFVFYRTSSGHSTLYGGGGSSRLKLLASGGVQVRNAADSDYDPIQASSFNVSSTRGAKKNIELLSENALQGVRDTKVHRYHLNADNDMEFKRIGLLYDEAVPEIVDPSGMGIDVYQQTSYLWKALQEEDEIVQSQEKRIQELESQMKDVLSAVQALQAENEELKQMLTT
ncbi:phage tail spike protein [Rossellomorea arthrocnemi]